jgi:hypothetical protein
MVAVYCGLPLIASVLRVAWMTECGWLHAANAVAEGGGSLGNDDKMVAQGEAGAR